MRYMVLRSHFGAALSYPEIVLVDTWRDCKDYMEKAIRQKLKEGFKTFNYVEGDRKVILERPGIDWIAYRICEVP
jgi:hypothetical protein